MIILKRLITILKMLSPRSVYKIILKYHELTVREEGRTLELKSIISQSNKCKTYVEVGVWDGENLFSIAKQFRELKCYGIDPYIQKKYIGYSKGEGMSTTNQSQCTQLYSRLLKKSTFF
jgi:tRNA G46 methylase TrmB